MICAASFAPIPRERLPGTLVDPRTKHCQVSACTVLMSSHDFVYAMLKGFCFGTIIDRGVCMALAHDDGR